MVNKCLSDKLGIHDDLVIQGEHGSMYLNMEKDKTQLIGEITITGGTTGKKLFTFNDVILPGATFVIEQMFKKRAPFAMTTLSADLGVNADSLPTDDNLKDESVFGFILGVGGITPPDTINAVKFNNKTVSTIVPMRIVPVSADLSPADRAKYGMKKQVGTDYYYYAKKFDNEVQIKHLYTDNTEVPANVNELTPSLGILVFGELTFTVSEDDLREYFIKTYGNIDTCRFNSIALVGGFNDGTDFGGVRAITKANLPNMYLNALESYYIFTYKVYCI